MSQAVLNNSQAVGHTDLLSGILKVQVRNEEKITEQDRIYCQNQQDELYKTLDQISIIADERKFVAALIVPDYKLVEKYAADKGIQYASMAELLKHDAIMELFKERIDTLQQQFAHYEQIKKFTLLPEPFSMAKGELTNTLKIKRSVLNKNYAAEIEAMYAE